mgnify:CR=1 FL=1
MAYTWLGAPFWGYAYFGSGQKNADIAFMLQMLDHQNNPVGDPQTHYITPKIEPSSYSPHQV